MWRPGKRVRAFGQAILRIILAGALLLAPGSGVGAVAKDATGLGEPLASRAAGSALVVLQTALRLSPGALLLVASTRPTAVADASNGVSGNPWSWGANLRGQVGDGTTTGRKTPVPVSNLTGVMAVAAGNVHSLALKSDGTVWGWGGNNYGAVGDGTTTDRTAPVQVSGLSGVVAIAAGTDQSLAVKSDGTVWAWGLNAYGQLGDGTTTTRLSPVQVSGLSGVVGVAGGGSHSLAVKSDGTVWAWG